MDWEFTGSSLMLTGRLARAPRSSSPRPSRSAIMRSRVGETVRNVGGERVETIWGSRLTLGGDLLGPDTVLDASATVVRPDPKASPVTSYDDAEPVAARPRAGRHDQPADAAGPDAGETRLAYLSDFTRPWLRVTPARPATWRSTWSGTGARWPHVWYRWRPAAVSWLPWYRARILPQPPPVHQLAGARRTRGAAGLRQHAVDLPGSARTSYRPSVHPGYATSRFPVESPDPAGTRVWPRQAPWKGGRRKRPERPT